MEGRMEENDASMIGRAEEDRLNYFSDFSGFLMQESHHTRRLSPVPATRNGILRPEFDPFYSEEEYLFQSSRNVRNFPENHHPTGLQPDVFYSNDMLQILGNGAIYSPPVFARNNLLNFRPQASWDPFCPGRESSRDPRSMDHGAPPHGFSLVAEFARLKLLHDYNQTSLSEPPSVYGNSSSLNRLRENQQFSRGDLQALRARAAANGFMSHQAYPSLNSDSYWVNRDSLNGGMNIGVGFNSWNRMQVSMNGVNSNMSWIPSPPCNGYLHGWVSYSDLKGRVLAEAMDQHGCRFLSRKLHEGKPEDIHMILSEIKDHIYMLLHDRFGNQVIQKLFQVCDQEQISQLVSAVTADGHLLMSVCLHPQGSQSIQKLVQCLVEPQQISRMMFIFRHITLPLVNNQIGTQVIQRCLIIFQAEETEEILNVIADHCIQIATNQSGCCVLQLCVTNDNPLESQRHIVTEIVLNVNELSKHEFGNYVVQRVIGLEIPNVMEGIVAGLKGNFVSLSMDKCGSNVVEKLMKACEEKFAPRIINELISNSLNFLNVVLDPYGNYVVQSAKACAKGASRKALNKLILEHSDELRSHPYGKNVLLNKEKARHSV